MSTYNDASLIYYPSGYKASKAYSLKPTDGSGDLTFTRASTATRVNESGLIEEVATGVPRIDYTGAGCAKLLLEPQRTNLITYSNEFSNPSWLKSSIVLDSNTLDTLSPQGLNNATKITSTTYPSLYNIISVSAQTQYTFSFYVKGGTLATPQLAIRDDSNGVFIVENILYATSIDEWTRIEYTVTTPIGCTSLRVYALRGTGSGTIFLYGAQVEQGSYSTSIINTSGTAVTRVADLASKSGISSLINSTEGVLYVEFNALADDRSSSGSYAISDGTTNNRFIISNSGGFDGGIASLGVVSGALVFNISSSGFNVKSFNKVALKYELNNTKLFVNGVLIGTDTSCPMPAPNTFNFLGSTNGTPAGGLRYGNTKGLMLFPNALSDAECIALTTL